MGINSETPAYKVGVVLKQDDIREVKGQLEDFFEGIQNEFESIWKITEREFGEFVQGTAQEMSKTWDSTTKDMKTLTGKALGGSVLAWFKGDMDQVEDVWENAWQNMLGSADKAWDGALDIVKRRPQSLLPKGKAPRFSPGP